MSAAEKTNTATTPLPPYEPHGTPVQRYSSDRDIPLASYPPQQPYHQPVAAAPAQQTSKYPTATPLHALQRNPVPVDCPACHQREVTQVNMHSGKTTHGWAAVLCFCACIGCLPYMMSSLKDVDHHCAKCGVLLATWHNSGRVEMAHASGSRTGKK